MDLDNKAIKSQINTILQILLFCAVKQMMQGGKGVRPCFNARFSYVLLLSCRRDSTVLEKVWTGQCCSTSHTAQSWGRTIGSIWLFFVPCIPCDLQRCSWFLVQDCVVSFRRVFFRSSCLSQCSYASFFMGKSLPDFLSLLSTLTTCF